jgi:hypothetical protein
MLDAPLDIEHAFASGLRGYIAAVSSALGVGLESSTIEPEAPASAYVALDWRLSRLPERDLAVMWDEVHGWSAAVESNSGEDLIVLTYLGGDILPEPRAVMRFLAAVRAGDHSVGQPDAPESGPVTDHAALLDRLLPYVPARRTR